MRQTIGIDVSPLVRDIYTGTEWYTYNLIKALAALDESKNFSFVLYAPSTASISLKLPDNFKWKILQWPFRRLWISGRLSIEMLLHPPDVLFVPANNLPTHTPSKVVTTIHDIGFVIQPSLYSKTQKDSLVRGLTLITKKSSKVLAISNTVRDHLLRYNNELGKRASVVPLSIDKVRLQKLSENTKKEIYEDYILYIGTLSKKKNAKALIKIFEKLSLNGFNKKLVLIGNEGHEFEKLQDTISNSSAKNNIVRKTWVSEEEYLNWLIHSDALIIPSLHEGFSLPILEAQLFKIPLILNDTPVHREVSGNVALFINIENSEESAKSIATYLKDIGLVSRVVAQGIENQSKYSLERTASQTLAILKEFL